MNEIQDNIIGSSWKSCSVWSKKGKINHGNKFNFVLSATSIEISYLGPSSGLVISHSKNGTDTMHQVFNVLICEFNPYLAKIKAKPLLDNISYKTWVEIKDKKKNYGIDVKIPLEKSDVSFQIDRRGGWNHDATSGLNEMLLKCKKNTNCYGPITKKFKGEFGIITEHFITLPL